MLRLLSVYMLTFVLAGCTALGNPFKQKTYANSDTCNTDLRKEVNLERLSFKVPELWTRIKPCQAGKIYHDMKRDVWGISAVGLRFKDNVFFRDGGMSLKVTGDLHRLGMKRESADEWLVRKKKMWKKAHRNDYPDERTFTRVKKQGLDCWKVNTAAYYQRFKNKSSTPVERRLLGHRTAYICWEPDDTIYPPITISAGISYRNDKPVYPFGIDKDLLSPVFESLKIKKLSEKALIARLEEHRKKVVSGCERIIKRARKDRKENKYQLFNDYLISSLKNCGYDVISLRKWWCESTIADNQGDKEKSQYRAYQKSLKENLKACSR